MKQNESQAALLEQRVQQGLRNQTNRITAPAEMDARIEHLFEQHHTEHSSARLLEKQNNNKKTTRFKYRFRLQTAVVLLFGIIMAGSITYASDLAYSITTGKSLMTYVVDTEHSLTPDEDAEIVHIVNEVRSQLAPGQSAYVYSSKFIKTAFGPILKVSRPYEYTAIQEWNQKLKPEIGTLPVPHYAPSAYTFDYGTDNYYYGAADYLYDTETKKMLFKGLFGNKLTHLTQDYSWMPFPSDYSKSETLPTPQLVYTSGSHHIEIMYLPASPEDKENTEIIGSGDVNVKVVQSNRGEMFYSTTESLLLSSSEQEPGEVHSLLLQLNDEQLKQPILLSINTDDPNLSEKELVKIAESIQ